MSIYQDNRYRNRQEYLKFLSEDYGVPLDTVEAVANLLGPEEDFDGLLAMLNEID